MIFHLILVSAKLSDIRLDPFECEFNVVQTRIEHCSWVIPKLFRGQKAKGVQTLWTGENISTTLRGKHGTYVVYRDIDSRLTLDDDGDQSGIMGDLFLAELQRSDKE